MQSTTAAAKRLTKAQKEALKRAAAAPREVTWGRQRGQAMAAWERMMLRLCETGLMRPYVHGGFEITDEGRRAIGQSQGDK